MVYRAAKLVQRYPVIVAIASVLVLTTMVGITGMATGLVVVRRDRDLAEDSFRQAYQAINQFFTRVSEERQLNQPELQPLRNALLKDTQHFYEHFLDERAGDTSHLSDLAATRARAARITRLTGTTTQAILQYEQAVVLWESLIASQPGNTTYQENLARTLSELGAVLLPLESRRDEALGIFRRAQSLIEPLTIVHPEVGPIRHELRPFSRTSLGSSEIKVNPRRRSRTSSGHWQLSRSWLPKIPLHSNRSSTQRRPMAT